MREVQGSRSWAVCQAALLQVTMGGGGHRWTRVRVLQVRIRRSSSVLRFRDGTTSLSLTAHPASPWCNFILGSIFVLFCANLTSLTLTSHAHPCPSCCGRCREGTEQKAPQAGLLAVGAGKLRSSAQAQAAGSLSPGVLVSAGAGAGAGAGPGRGGPGGGASRTEPEAPPPGPPALDCSCLAAAAWRRERPRRRRWPWRSAQPSSLRSSCASEPGERGGGRQG